MYCPTLRQPCRQSDVIQFKGRGKATFHFKKRNKNALWSVAKYKPRIIPSVVECKNMSLYNNLWAWRAPVPFYLLGLPTEIALL